MQIYENNESANETGKFGNFYRVCKMYYRGDKVDPNWLYMIH